MTISQLIQRMRQHVHAFGQIFRGRIFVRRMADAVAARDEQHRGRDVRCDDLRIVSGAAMHEFVRNAVVVTLLLDRFHDAGICQTLINF